MNYKINISNLTLDQLNESCLVRISQFAVALEKLNGSVLELNSNSLMRDLVMFAKNTDNKELKILYISIKKEISEHINSANFDLFNEGHSELSTNPEEPSRKSVPKKH